MATKKSSSAAKKKAAPKKQAAKKKSTTVRKPTDREESAALYANDESTTSSLPEVKKSSNDKNESGNGIYLFLVLAGIAAIAYLGYAKFTGKKAEPKTEQTSEAPKPVTETKPTETVDPLTAPEEAAKAALAKYAVDKIESGKKWEEAGSYCKSLGASLPTKTELTDYAKDAPKELKSDDTFWTSNVANDSKKAFVFSFKTGVKKTLKTEKHKVLCKN